MDGGLVHHRLLTVSEVLDQRYVPPSCKCGRPAHWVGNDGVERCYRCARKAENDKRRRWK